MSDSPTFEQALTELDKIVRALEDGTTTLEESLAQYERGVKLLKSCYGQLQVAEQKITQLAGLDGEGKPALQAFDHAASDATEAKRRAVRGKAKDSMY